MDDIYSFLVFFSNSQIALKRIVVTVLDEHTLFLMLHATERRSIWAANERREGQAWIPLDIVYRAVAEGSPVQSSPLVHMSWGLVFLLLERSSISSIGETIQAGGKYLMIRGSTREGDDYHNHNDASSCCPWRKWMWSQSLTIKLDVQWLPSQVLGPLRCFGTLSLFFSLIESQKSDLCVRFKTSTLV